MNSISLFNQNIAEIKVSYSHTVKCSDMERLGSSQDTYELLQRIWSPDLDYREEFVIILLNRANRVLGVSRISQGGVSGTVADPKIIFQTALKVNASCLILAHNHPSGNTKPSEADIQLTKRLKEAGICLDIPILDHLIITSETYLSFADDGLL